MADLTTYGHAMENGKYDWKSAERYLDSFYEKSMWSRLKDDIDLVRCTLSKAKSLSENRVATEERKLEFRQASKEAKIFRKNLKKGNFGSDEEKERQKIKVYSRYARCMNECETFFGYEFPVPLLKGL